MKPYTQYSPEFKEQALSKVRERGHQTVPSIAQELNMSLSTLKGWMKASSRAAKGLPHGATPLSPDLPSQAWGAAQRLQALNESFGLQDEALHAWCRQNGLFTHQLAAWRHAFCAPNDVSASQTRAALRELQSKNSQLQQQLNRKDKALAEAAALLVLQKKFQALWVEEV